MFNPKLINELLRQTPFKPFRVCMSDGKTYDVLHPEMVYATTSCVEIGLTVNPDNVVDDIARCAVLHIARVEDIPVSKAA